MYFYKITNTESELYKRFKELREKELAIEEENLRAIAEFAGSEFTDTFGKHGQQNVMRVSSYTGFKFIHPEKLKHPKAWRTLQEHPDIYVATSKTKAGREAREFLLNGLKGSMFHEVYEILGVKPPVGEFVFPYVEHLKRQEIIVIGISTFWFDKPDVQEITRTEFNRLIQYEQKLVEAGDDIVLEATRQWSQTLQVGTMFIDLAAPKPNEEVMVVVDSNPRPDTKGKEWYLCQVFDGETFFELNYLKSPERPNKHSPNPEAVLRHHENQNILIIRDAETKERAAGMNGAPKPSPEHQSIHHPYMDEVKLNSPEDITVTSRNETAANDLPSIH